MASLQSFDDLVAFLVENKLPHRLDVAHQLVELPSNAAPLPGNLYLRWEKTVPFMQIIHFMLENLPEDRLSEVEAAIARLNNTLEVGGFGIDHEQRRLYCRLTVPVLPPDGINPMTLNQLGIGVVRNARTFVDPLKEVVEGKPGTTIIELVKATIAQRGLPQ